MEKSRVFPDMFLAMSLEQTLPAFSQVMKQRQDSDVTCLMSQIRMADTGIYQLILQVSYCITLYPTIFILKYSKVPCILMDCSHPLPIYSLFWGVTQQVFKSSSALLCAAEEKDDSMES